MKAKNIFTKTKPKIRMITRRSIQPNWRNNHRTIPLTISVSGKDTAIMADAQGDDDGHLIGHEPLPASSWTLIQYDDILRAVTVVRQLPIAMKADEMMFREPQSIIPK